MRWLCGFGEVDMSETCENCRREIGRLETAHIHAGHVVCGECKSRLGGEIVYATPLASVPPRVVELTAKKWKVHQVASFLLLMATCAATVLAVGQKTGPQLSDAAAACIFAMVAALAYFLWSLFMSWWHHG